jgi:ferredoxin
MKITIDVSKCAGHGRCYSFAPELIESDDEGCGVAEGKPVPAELAESARQAAGSCPESAVLIAD